MKKPPYRGFVLDLINPEDLISSYCPELIEFAAGSFLFTVRKNLNREWN